MTGIVRTFAAGVTLLSTATAAMAQQDVTPAERLETLGEFEGAGDFVVAPLGLDAEALGEMDIYDAEGREVGEVETLLVDSAGQVVALAVETEEFLGIGDEVIVPLSVVELAEDRLTTSLTEEQMANLPEWED